MARLTVRQVVTVTAMAAALTGVGSGVAAGSPPADGPVGMSTMGRADAFITGADVAADFHVYAPEGIPAFGVGELFVAGAAGYVCTPDDVIAATVDGLDSATAVGRLNYTCESPDAPPVTGSAVFDLTWTGHGEITKYTQAGNEYRCMSHIQQRQAYVSGTVHVLIAELGIDQPAGPIGEDDDALSVRHEICAPGRN